MSDLNQDHLPYPVEEHGPRLMCGDPIAQAYEWIAAYARNLADQCNADDSYGTVTVDDLMEAADSHQGEGWGDYINRGGAFEGESVDPTFWEKYAIVRGKPLDEVEQNSFFTCSC